MLSAAGGIRWYGKQLCTTENDIAALSVSFTTCGLRSAILEKTLRAAKYAIIKEGGGAVVMLFNTAEFVEPAE